MSGFVTGVIPSRVNPDLQEERDRASFNVTELTHIIDGGAEKTTQRKRIESILFGDPDFRGFQDAKAFGSKSDFYSAMVHKSTKLFKLKQELRWSEEEFGIALRIAGQGMALNLQHDMFIPALERLATKEQKAKWLIPAKQYKIIGTYAQTEMGHVGKSSNHAVVLATLIIKGKKYGMHPFFVQIRSMEDHTPMPGIKIGDIGPRMGRLTSDNGYLILNNIRIPRENMLMKNAQVSPDGTFTAKAPNQANYATMVMVRVDISQYSSYLLSQGATIGIRYSAVRRQSKLDPKEREPKILEYQTQQFKLFPALAFAYAIFFSSRSLRRNYTEAYTEIQKGNLQKLPELHCQSAGMKAFCSDNMLRELEIIRQSCGGHGYLNASGIAMLVTTAAPIVTVEGETTVMYLQVARTVSRAAKLVQTDVLSGIPQHLAFNKNLVNMVRAAKAHCYYSVVKDFSEAVQILKASHQTIKVLRTLCCFFAVHGVVEESGDFLEEGISNNTRQVVAPTAKPQNTQCKNTKQTSTKRRVRDKERQRTTQKHQTQRTTHKPTRPMGNRCRIRTAICHGNNRRPNAVALVDAFDHRDMALSSAIGSYDGNAYERLFKSAEKDPMNNEEVHQSYHQYLRSFIQEMNKAKL
ncbi:hypothetical protein FSP39_008857 [Pinctada imbricata]|uniref:Acyl-coenzyme A oxidase n=1 Tax=Pinctada imbricata TaxID=66713 RepID=A0AA89CA89_PINIB|nr:hypothetical protein FSP39_008857 [Pinctada imbricata]